MWLTFIESVWKKRKPSNLFYACLFLIVLAVCTNYRRRWVQAVNSKWNSLFSRPVCNAQNRIKDGYYYQETSRETDTLTVTSDQLSFTVDTLIPIPKHTCGHDHLKVILHAHTWACNYRLLLRTTVMIDYYFFCIYWRLSFVVEPVNFHNGISQMRLQSLILIIITRTQNGKNLSAFVKKYPFYISFLIITFLFLLLPKWVSSRL